MGFSEELYHHLIVNAFVVAKYWIYLLQKRTIFNEKSIKWCAHSHSWLD
jgi:hypothetical protein